MYLTGISLSKRSSLHYPDERLTRGLEQEDSLVHIQTMITSTRARSTANKISLFSRALVWQQTVVSHRLPPIPTQVPTNPRNPLLVYLITGKDGYRVRVGKGWSGGQAGRSSGIGGRLLQQMEMQFRMSVLSGEAACVRKVAADGAPAARETVKRSFSTSIASKLYTRRIKYFRIVYSALRAGTPGPPSLPNLVAVAAKNGGACESVIAPAIEAAFSMATRAAC